MKDIKSFDDVVNEGSENLRIYLLEEKIEKLEETIKAMEERIKYLEKRIKLV